MPRVLNHSDILLIRSAEHEEHFFRCSAQTPPPTGADSATNRAGHTWVTDRDPQIVAGPIVIASTDLGTGPSVTCPRSPEPANARALAMCRTRLTPKSLRFSPTTESFRRCSTRFARSMPSFCVAARASTKWIRLSQRSILPRRAPSSPT
jgi:hypothetical protein